MSQQLDTLEAQLSQASDALKRQHLQERITTTTEQHQRLAQDQQSYHTALEAISLTVHPFILDTQQWQLADELSARLAIPLKTLTEWVQSYGGERASTAIATFQTHIPSFAQGIQAWWQWVTQALSTQTQDLERHNWVLIALLPWVYWSQQADRTRQGHLKYRYQQAASDADDPLMGHPMTLRLKTTELQQWGHWGQWICSKSQRTSSAVEGRNGYLSKLHHAGRGFSEQSLKGLTIIHNFGLKRSDGTTAAQRLFGHSFPDVFEWMLMNITDLPMPRKSANTPQLHPLHGESVSA